MFHGIKYLIVSLVFPHLGFWSGNLFLIAPFSDLCLLVPFCPQRLTQLHYEKSMATVNTILEHGDVHTKLTISQLLFILDH